MANIDIRRSHRLDPETLRERIDHLAERLQAKFDARCSWEGDRLRFERSGASGYIELTPEAVAVHLKLGLMLRPLKGTIAQTIESYLDRELEDRT